MAAVSEDIIHSQLKEILSSTYVSLDFDQETRDILRRDMEQCCCAHRHPDCSRTKSDSKPKNKLLDFFKCSGTKDKDMSCDDIFYTASSKTPLRAIGVKMAVTSTHNDRDKNKCYRSSRCLFEPMIKCPLISWFILAFGTMIYILARCMYNRDFIKFWQTSEGHIVLSIEVLIIIFGLYMVWRLIDGKKQSLQQHNQRPTESRV
ncbi:uncharacterized protein [Parasteatoda tepidariorum]|uniref:uncharacterized protein n=1 Tax=Parasteatoda tepidariorum TaxID=114398 RepID=UPI00077FAF73|nr:uncharacterized protein LOC107445669 [Parasteatoda tepidariorum]